MRGLAVDFALAAEGFFLHHGNAGAIDLHIENGNRLALDSGQIQPHGALNLEVFPCLKVFADGLGLALDGLGGDLQTGQQTQLLAPLIERRRLAHQRLHAAHAGGERGVVDVEFGVGGKAAHVAVRAAVVGASDLAPTQRGEQRLGAKLLVVELVAARTSQAALFGRWLFQSQ